MEIAQETVHLRAKSRRIGLPSLLTSIRFRLTMWYVLILAVVLAVFSSLVYASQAQNLRAEMNDALRKDGQRLASAYNPKDGQINIPVQPKGKASLLREGDIMILLDSQNAPVQVLGQINVSSMRLLLSASKLPDAMGNNDLDSLLKKLDVAKQSGEIIDAKQAAAMLAGLTHTSEDFFSFTFRDEQPGEVSYSPNYLFYSTMLMIDNERVGTLMLGRPREDEAELQSLLLTLLMVAPITLLFAAGGGYWLAARAMRPVRTMARAAQEIGETELHRRLNLDTHDELGELASTFDGMLDRLEAAFQRQRQFTADASHELRTPLTIVDLEVSHALTVPQTPEEYRRALAVIGDEATCMARLVNDLLTLARADAGRIALRHEEIDLSDLTLEVVERLDSLAQQNGVQLCTQDLPELKITGDRLYLGQMLTNLVENAIKYSNGAQKWVRIETGSQPDGERTLAWVRVEDNGPGIAPGHLSHLFDRFYRVDKARSRNGSVEGDSDSDSETQPIGSGLGLSIVQWVVQAHGGRVKVESRVGCGSRFEVLLPVLSP